jgi:hypothetical protein
MQQPLLQYKNTTAKVPDNILLLLLFLLFCSLLALCGDKRLERSRPGNHEGYAISTAGMLPVMTLPAQIAWHGRLSLFPGDLEAQFLTLLSLSFCLLIHH